MKTRPVYRPFHMKVEGRKTGDWMIVDTGDALIHLMSPHAREYYNLEKLWVLKESFYEVCRHSLRCLSTPLCFDFSLSL
jgi:Ribosomal silencing factor during starvation